VGLAMDILTSSLSDFPETEEAVDLGTYEVRF
jgi:hypothetical protein